MSYDNDNIFAKILRGEIPCKKIAEDEHTLAFEDINPLRAVHVLVIPKGPYVDWRDFSATASADEQAAFTRMIAHVADLAGIAEGHVAEVERADAARDIIGKGRAEGDGAARDRVAAEVV